MYQRLTRKPEFYGTVVTEVQVTSDLPPQSPKRSVTLPPHVHSSLRGGKSRSHLGNFDHDEEDAIAGVSQNFEAACSSNTKPCPRRSIISRLRSVKSSASLKLKKLDPVKMSYLKTSFIFAFAVLITWIPSSINRLYSLTHDGKVSFQLSVASGCVLPLQGVWNCIIFFTTS